MKIPFSIYDIFAYIAPGLLLLVVLDLLLGGTHLNQDNLELGMVIFWIGVAYIVGHIIEPPSEILLETYLVEKCFKPPRENLFRPDIVEKNGSQKSWWKLIKKKLFTIKTKLYPHYYRNFPDSIQKKILSKIKSEEFNAQPGEAIISKIEREGFSEQTVKAMFQYVFSKVKVHENLLDRLELFTRLYAFCRNMSFCLFSTSIMFISIGGWDWHMIWRALATLFASYVMFVSYLKYYRHHSYDMFLSYLGLSEKNGKGQKRYVLTTRKDSMT